MKKVWILERFISKEEMEKSMNELYEIREFWDERDDAEAEAAIKTCDEMIVAYEKRMNANPDGYWLGYQGKIIYRQFCSCAHETMRYFKEGLFRVVKAEIEDSASQWIGYKNPVVNDGVLRYLYATL